MNSREASRKSRQSRNTVFRNNLIGCESPLCEYGHLEPYPVRRRFSCCLFPFSIFVFDNQLIERGAVD